MAKKKGATGRVLHDPIADHLTPMYPLDLAKARTVDALVRAMGQTAFTGRQVGDAADVLEAMARDKDCFIVMTLAGAMTVAKMGLIFCDLIESGIVKAIVSTGALMAHGLVEATKRAFRVRDRVVTDPDKVDGNFNSFLADEFLDAEAGKIDAKRAAVWPAPYGEGDTIWMGAADASGLVVSYIQSLYWEFGSGCVLPATGVLVQNRGSSFSLDPKALNVLTPGRRPFHTLNPAIASLKGGGVMAYGTMGGDGQPQSQAAVFTRHAAFRQPLEQALDAPRWLLGRTWGSTHTNLRLEKRFDGQLIDRLMSAGHNVQVLDEAYSDTMGHAGAVILHPDGTLEGGHDPRADGGAAGA